LDRCRCRAKIPIKGIESINVVKLSSKFKIDAEQKSQ